MKILLFNYSELGFLGGVEVAVCCLADEFTQRGHPTGVIEMGDSWRPRRSLPSGTPVWTIAGSSEPSAFRPRSWASFARASWQFARVVQEFDADVVNVHFPLGQALPVVGAHVLPHRWQLVVTVHNSDIRVSPVNDPATRVWQARLFARAAAVTAVSRSLLEDTVRLYPDVLSKGRVIENGVGPVWFRDDVNPPGPGRERYVLFVGRLAPAKGVDILLRAWQRVAPRSPETRLWIVGSGPESEKLAVMAKELGILESVRFLGRKSQEELPHLYRHAEVVALPSRNEGMPFAVLEALASGAVTISTRIPGVAELIEDGVSGYLIETDSPDGLAARLMSALKMCENEKRRMRDAARAMTRARFSMDKTISAYLDLFASIVGGRPRERRVPAIPWRS